MRAYHISSDGAQAQLCEVDFASPKVNEVRIQIKACGLNFADILIQKGTYQDIPPAPFTMGLEVSGIIDAVGPSVSDWNVGDRVAVYAGQGGLAEYGVFPVERLIRMPDAMSFEHAAAFPVAYGTSHVALDQRAGLRKGETLLVTGAAGGVGLTAVEIGKLMGARVIAHARGSDKLAVAKAAGADHLIDDSEDLRARLIELGRVDVVYDAVGGDAFTAAFRACRPGGRLLSIGFASGTVPQIPANHLMVKNLSVIGFYIGGYMKSHPQVMRDSMEQLSKWYQDGLLKPHISHILPLDEVEYGLDLLRNRRSTGKVVITP